jgi:hypothetical protein
VFGCVQDPWKSDEQFLLEQGLRQIGKDDPERWEKIAAHVKTRTKKVSWSLIHFLLSIDVKAQTLPLCLLFPLCSNA